MELIKIEDKIAILDEKTSCAIADWERKIKELKAQEDELKSKLKEEMEAKNIKSIKDEVNGLTITYIAPSEKEVFDAKKFKEENEDLYDDYIKFSPVKSSIRIVVK